jgi:hypothetical protein
MKSGKLFGILVLSLLMMVSVETDAMGQGRGRRMSRLDNKCSKFVNCHDARDGRVDGRGPARSRFTNIFGRNRRNRDRDFDDTRRRHRHRGDRDFDRDRSWRHRQ